MTPATDEQNADIEEGETEQTRSADRFRARPSWRQRLAAQPLAGIGAGLLIIIVVFGALAPQSFLTTDNLRYLALDNSTLAIVAVAVGIVMISGGFDLSAGAVIAFSQVVAAQTFQALGGADGGAVGIVAGLAVALACGTAWGAINGLLVTRLSTPPFIATLATAGIALGIALVISDGTDLSVVPRELTATLSRQDIGGVPVLVAITAGVVLLMAYLLRRTRFGQRIYAIGSDSTAAERAGIPVSRYRVRIYALAGTAYGLVAFLDMARLSTTTVAGYSDTALYAITAVAIGGGSLFGGTGTALGTLVGVTIPAVLHNGFVIIGVPSYYERIGVGIALVLALYADHLRRSATRMT